MKRTPLPAALLIACLLAILTVVGLAVSHQQVGYVRDEGIYFDASRSYGAWAVKLVNNPGKALEQKVRDRHFAPNHEHPALMKILAGVSAATLAKPAGKGKSRTVGRFPMLLEGAAMRLPAQLFAGIGVALLFLVGARRGGLFAGLLAAGSFILLPRVWFHAGLHAFDVPVAVAILAVVLAYQKSLRSPGWAVALGALLGFAIAVKHNALFVGPLLAVHYYAALLLERHAEGKPIALARWVPLPLVSMAVLAPIVALGLWPWLWTDPVARFNEYMAFHSQHAWYNMEFLGANYNQPPMPVSYPFVLTWATVPTVILLLGGLGLALGLRRDLGRRPVDGASDQRSPGLLLSLFVLAPLLLIAWPWTPIFGGTKHWITAYPFVALAAAEGWTVVWAALRSHPKVLVWQTLALGLCLGPSAVATIDGHPFNLSQYAPLVGGARGAANLGLGRGFWGHAVGTLPASLAESSSGRGTVYLHDLHELSRRQFEREGRWPAEVRGGALGQSRAGFLFHELHMTTYETQLWNRFGTTAPSQVLSLDDVPLTSLYEARGPGSSGD